MKLFVLILVLASTGCATKIMSGDQLSQKAKACLDANMDIKVLQTEDFYNGGKVDIVCIAERNK